MNTAPESMWEEETGLIRSVAEYLALESGEQLVVCDVMSDRARGRFTRCDRTVDAMPVLGGDVIVERNGADRMTGARFNTPGSVVPDRSESGVDEQVARNCVELDLGGARRATARS